ncbi:MAG: hypothetical protein U5K56_06925 [Halioglobus sp.]|nr:hypothetical protein [Halioglobus sp.]
METGIYFPPSIQRFEPKRVVFSTWIDHICFAYDLVAAVRPKLIVELGVYNGLSFFTFCQSMVENDIDGVAYGIDCWEGDERTRRLPTIPSMKTVRNTPGITTGV